MLSTEAKGKTVDEAIFAGLTELGLQFDEVNIEIVSEGTKGIFGLGKNAVVRLTQKQSEKGIVTSFLDELFEKMGISANASVTENENGFLANITGDSTGVLIGRRGETLDAIQYLTSLVVNKDKDQYKRIMIDTEGYRKKREETLVRLANRLAVKVSKTGRRVALEPMNPYERRILHAALQDNPRVETISEGEDPNRRVIIVRTKRGNNGSDRENRSYGCGYNRNRNSGYNGGYNKRDN